MSLAAARLAASSLLLASSAFAAEPAHQENLNVLKNAAQIRSLSPADAQPGHPVHLRGVVTYYDSEWGHLFVQDSQAGIFVSPLQASLPIQTGDLVEVEGLSATGDFAPIIASARITALGRGVMPLPREVSFDHLASGREDSNWVELRGVVRSVSLDRGHLVLDISSAGNRFKARIPGFTGKQPEELVGAAVRIRGVCGTVFNQKRQMVGVKLFTPDLREIKVEEPGASDPFGLPTQPIGTLLQFSPQTLPGRRVKVAGVVTFQRAGELLIVQDGADGLYVQTSQMTTVQPGDRVEILGFPALVEHSPVLEDGVFRRIGGGRPPTPVDLSAERVLTSDAHAKLVRLEARLVDLTVRPNEGVLVLQSDDLIFPARLDAASGGNSLKELREGSVLQVTGVCLVDADKDQEPRSFRLLLSSPGDVRVLAQPTWWDIKHTLATLGLMMLLVIAALAWVASLRYRVREQTEIIRRRLEHQTVLEERFKDLVEHAVEGIFRIAPDGRYAAVNKALARMLGYSSPTEVIDNRNHSDCQNYVASDRHVEFLRLLDERGSVERFEYQARRKDGSVIWVSENARAVRGTEGELLYYEGTVVDVTERKRAEEALRKSKEQFEAFMDHNPAVAFLRDEEGRYLYANRAWERQFPTERADWKGKTDYDFWPAETAKLFRESDLAALAMDHSLEKLESAYDAKGSLRYWMVFKFAIKTAEGRRAVGGLALDITDRQQAEESLRQSDERFSKAFRASPIPICISTLKEGRYLDVNDSFLQLLGFSREEVIGHTSLELRIWAEPSDLAKMVQRLREQKYLRDTEIDLRAKSGEMRRVLFSIEFIEIESESCTLAILHDVTDRLRLEEQLRQAQKMEAVGQLAAGVAHDFNNILTVIQGNAGLLQSNFGLAPELCELAKQISVASARAAGLTRQLLMFSRKQVIQPRALDLNELISNLTKMLSRIIGEHINLQFNYYPRLPEIYADPGMIEQVILNLAVNARDAMAQTGQLMLSTSAVEIDEDTARLNPEARAGYFVCLSVTDNGSGMDAATQRRIFEPFFTTKEVGKGTGLGLATVYGIIKQHQGWIEVMSRPGLGTTFQIFFPSRPKVSKERTETASTAMARTGSETILVVEDEPALCGLVKDILLRYGYRVLTAGSGVEALQVWATHKQSIDLLLTDMVMPQGVSGRELAEQVQKEKPELEVLYTSGYSTEMLGTDFALQPGIRFLQKPYEPETLAKAIRVCLDE